MTTLGSTHLVGSNVVGAALVVACLAASPVVAQTDPVRLYAEAQAREQALRVEMATKPANAASSTLQRRIRTLVGAYRDLARLFPASGVADKALWQGAMLSADSFWQWGHAVDQTSALRAFAALSSSFPSSSLTRQARGHARRVADARATVQTTVQTPAQTTAQTTAQVPPAATTRDEGVVFPQTFPQTSSQTVPPRTGAPAAVPQAARPVARAPVPVVEAAAAGTVRPPAPLPPALSPSAATLVAIRHEALAGATRVTLELDREVPFSTDRLDHPSRVFVDLKQTRVLEALRDAVVSVDSGALDRIRVGRQPGGVTRVVLDLSGASRAGVYPLYAPYRVVVDLESERRTAAPAAPALPSAPAVAAAQAPLQGPLPRTRATQSTLRALASLPALPPAAAESANQAVVVAPSVVASPADVPRQAPPPAAASRTARGDYSLSRQLGLGIARIVIDAGHGGRDPGARVRGLSEAAFVLDIAQRLAQLLEAQPGVEVVHTRKGDHFVSLEERTEMANRAGADLFVSIHANASSNPKTRGVETYVLNFASSSSAEAVAARENAGSSGTMRQLPEIVKAIALNNKLDESRELARFVQDSLHGELHKRDRALKDLGVKQAPFMVLVGATMPAILTEVAFLTSQADGPALHTEKYRQQVAEAIMRGIMRYQQSLKKVAAVAAQ